ncbi:MAG: rod shape-determining protein MreC [Candidatus Omnitrophota bacterium]
MLWRFQKEVVLILLCLLSGAIFRLTARGYNTTGKTPIPESAVRYQKSYIQELTLENRRLRDLLHLKERKGGTIAAIGEVTSVDPIGWPIWLTVATNQSEGIRENLLVLDKDGNLIGQVVRQDGNLVRVMTILNPQSRISVSLQESGNLGVLESTGPLSIQVGYIPAENEVKVNEPIVTSRISQHYPPGLPVGTVQKSSVGKGFFREVSVRPNANFSTLKEVVIVY